MNGPAIVSYGQLCVQTGTMVCTRLCWVHKALVSALPLLVPACPLSSLQAAGKSWFLYYVIWKLRTAHQAAVTAAVAAGTIPPAPLQIVLQLAKVAGITRYLFHSDGVEEGDDSSFTAVLSNPCAFYLVDGCPPKPTACGRRALTVMVAAPDERAHYHKFEKENTVDTRYMPVWTYTELEAARKVMFSGVSAEKLKDHYRIAGGSIRLCLAKPFCVAGFDPKSGDQVCGSA